MREAGTWYLRVFIDAPGGVNIDQCEEVSRALSDKLDEEDPIEGQLCAGGGQRRRGPGAQEAGAFRRLSGRSGWT